MKNERTELLMSTYKPQLALMVYQSGNSYYLESHDINDAGNLMEGKPLLQETIQNMVDVFFDEKRNTIKMQGIIPVNVLHFEHLPGGNYKMIWHRPAEVRIMHFASQLKLNTGKTWVPAMAYQVVRNSLSVYALKTNTRPVEKTKLLRAPFHNVSDDGEVCLGNATVKKPTEKTYESLMKYWEDLFWLSEFTHFNGSDKPVKTDLNKVYKKLLASKTKLKWNDMDELVPYKSKTLKTILK
jgi:PRTRC genetic system protein B